MKIIKVILMSIGAMICLFIVCGVISNVLESTEQSSIENKNTNEEQQKTTNDSSNISIICFKRDSLIALAITAVDNNQLDKTNTIINDIDNLIASSLQTEAYLNQAKSKVDDMRKLIEEYSSHTELMNLSDDDFRDLCSRRFNKQLLPDSEINKRLIQMMYKLKNYRMSFLRKQQREKEQQDANKVLIDLEAPVQIGTVYMSFGRLAGSSRMDVFFSECSGLMGRQRLLLDRITIPERDCPQVYKIASVVFPYARYYTAICD